MLATDLYRAVVSAFSKPQGEMVAFPASDRARTSADAASSVDGGREMHYG